MERYKISKLLNDLFVSKVGMNKWIEVNDLSSGQNSANKNIKFKTSMLRPDLCDFSDAYIFVKGTIAVEGDDDAKIMSHLYHAHQKSIEHLQTMQKILMVLC